MPDRRLAMWSGGAVGLGLAVLVAMMGGTPPPAAAQGLNLGSTSDSRPIEIQADSGIEWQQDAQVYIARGNAVATRGTSAVHADTLIAHYRPAAKGSTTAEGSNEIYRIDADGHVTITGPSQTIVGDHAIYDVDQTVAVVTGKGLKMTTPTDVVTARDSLEWYDQKQIGVARGDAVAVQKGKTIKADVLTAYMTKTPAAKPAAAPARPVPIKAAARPAATPVAPDENSKISRIDAQGHVVVTNGTDIGHGDYGVYNADTGICTLIGNVVIVRARDVVKGQYAVMDLNRNISRMMPAPHAPGSPGQRVEGLFVRQDAPAAGSAAAGKSTPAAGRTP